MTKTLLGYIGIDSGLIAIGDPDYAGRLTAELDEWRALAEIVPREQLRSPEGQVYFTEPASNPNPLGVIAHTASGDGLYPVYRLTDDEGNQSLTIELGKALGAE